MAREISKKLTYVMMIISLIISAIWATDNPALEQKKKLFRERAAYALVKDIAEIAEITGVMVTDCEALVHFIFTGVPNHCTLERVAEKNVYEVDPNNPNHSPYTGYYLMIPVTIPHRKGFGFQHAFVVLDDGKILARNGSDAIRVYPSYKEMLIYDNPQGLADTKGNIIKNLTNIPHGSKFGECVAFKIDELSGIAPPQLLEKEKEGAIREIQNMGRWKHKKIMNEIKAKDEAGIRMSQDEKITYRQRRMEDLNKLK
jgi:hypothetical protein